MRYRTNAIVVLLWHYLTLGISQRGFERRYKMDNQDNNINSGIVQTLSNLLKSLVPFFSQEVKAISGLVILMTFCIVLIMVVSKEPLLALFIFLAVIIAVIFLYWTAYYFKQQSEHDVQIVNACKEIQKSLKRLINPKASSSIIAILPVVGEILQQVSKCLKKPKQQREANEKLTELLNRLKEVIAESKDVVDQVAIWLEAGDWLEKHRNELIAEAVDVVSKKYSWLVGNKKEQLKDGIYEHIKWVQENLDNADNFLAIFKELDISKLDLPLRGESYVYRETFEFLEKEITNQKNLPLTAKEVLLDFIRELISEYNS